MSRYLLTAELLVAFTFIHLLGVGRKYVTSRRQFLYTSYIIVVTVSRVKVNRVTARVIYAVLLTQCYLQPRDRGDIPASTPAN